MIRRPDFPRRLDRLIRLIAHSSHQTTYSFPVMSEGKRERRKKSKLGTIA
jgi:hypothetical protein